MPKKITRIFSFLLCFVLVFQQTGFSQIAGELDLSSHFQHLGGLFSQDTFRPLHLRYLSYDALSNNFNLLLDKGDQKGTFPKGTPFETQLEEETKKLLEYFFIGISIPNDKFWVNLRPDSPDNIIDPALAKTDIGRIFLEADLQLKKDTANYTSPQTPEGREYWERLYKKAGELYGNENITIPTLTRPWIVPGEIIIRESKDNAYIYKATLKVMLEQDYLKDSAVYSFKDERSKALNEYSSQLIRELIIPKLTKEVNSSKRYASLRQVYYSLILAQWFKQKFPHQQGRNFTELASKEDWSKTTYFNAYKKSFAEGEYNIKEPVYTPTGQAIRSYFSGGLNVTGIFDADVTRANALGNIFDNPHNLPAQYNSDRIVFPQLTVTLPIGSSPLGGKNKDSQIPRHWDSSWRIPNQEALEKADAFVTSIKEKLLRKKGYLEQGITEYYLYFINKNVARIIDIAVFDAKPAFEVLRALYYKYPKFAAGLAGSMSSIHHLFWYYSLESLEVTLFHKLIDDAIRMNITNEAILIDEVKYIPSYGSIDLGGPCYL